MLISLGRSRGVVLTMDEVHEQRWSGESFRETDAPIRVLEVIERRHPQRLDHRQTWSLEVIGGTRPSATRTRSMSSWLSTSADTWQLPQRSQVAHNGQLRHPQSSPCRDAVRAAMMRTREPLARA